ncbi:hypothetical protein ACFWWM_34840 [Streptomyces sp. NPDC058682]|uniref:hypothetical protein n=1 Tax=Streptomyces sp. NPDC058682 TaxID=3346596 RepID=UPI0036490B2C
MILLLGLVVLIAAIVVGLAGIFGNTGAGHVLGIGGDFSIFGYHATGSTGSLFLSGIIVGAVALLGLTLVMIGARRSARRSAQARRELGASRREAVAVDRERNEPVRSATTSAPTPARAPVADTRRSRGHWFDHRAAPR